jgi:hypothetical protein
MGEWAVTMDVRVEMMTGLVKTWSEERQAVGLEEEARAEAKYRLSKRLQGDWPGYRQIEAEARSTRLVVGRDEMIGPR